MVNVVPREVPRPVYTTKLTSLITFFKRFSYFEPVTSDPSDPGGVS